VDRYAGGATRPERGFSRGLISVACLKGCVSFTAYPLGRVDRKGGARTAAVRVAEADPVTTP